MGVVRRVHDSTADEHASNRLYPRDFAVWRRTRRGNPRNQPAGFNNNWSPRVKSFAIEVFDCMARQLLVSSRRRRPIAQRQRFERANRACKREETKAGRDERRIPAELDARS